MARATSTGVLHVVPLKTSSVYLVRFAGVLSCFAPLSAGAAHVRSTFCVVGFAGSSDCSVAVKFCGVDGGTSPAFRNVFLLTGSDCFLRLLPSAS